jgi:hypothetical protein
MATELPILQCTLDAAGVKEQARRYAEVAPHVGSITRTDHSLIAAVDAEVDQDLLNELIDAERACCQFFTIEYDGDLLSFAVSDPEHAPALGVIEDALTR